MYRVTYTPIQAQISQLHLQTQIYLIMHTSAVTDEIHILAHTRTQLQLSTNINSHTHKCACCVYSREFLISIELL